MTLSQWNPVKQLDEMQKRFAAVWGLEPIRPANNQETSNGVGWIPRVDITEDDREFLVKMELPEMKKEDIKVTVEDGALSISGERTLKSEEKSKKHHRIEREYGTFFRSFGLPPGTLSDKVNAEFKDGLLCVHLPKEAPAAPSKTVEVKAA